jgi:N-acetylmuramoyl-L-alanine amidase
MQRRNFLYYSSLIMAAFTVWPRKVLGRLNPGSFLFSGLSGRSEPITVISASLQIEGQIVPIEKWGYRYIDLGEFAQTLHLGIYTNEERQKTVLYIGKDRITFAANNTFINVNGQILQITLEALWIDDRMWVPLDHLVAILNKYTTLTLNLNEGRSQLSIERTDVNVTGIRITEKENGTLIQVFATRKFSDKDIVLDIRYNYFHIDIFGAKINPHSIAATATAGIISKIEAFQLGETASIGFRLKGEILGRDLVLNADSNDFYVNLRTKEIVRVEETDEPESGEQIQKVKDELEQQKKKWLVDTIVIDAGHGGKDPGALGYSKIKEKDIVLPIALYLGDLIQKNLPEVRVIFTRDSDVFIPLWKRTKIANDADANLFISIHCNSNKNRNANGLETYFLSADKDTKATEVVLKENSAIEFEESEDRQRYEGLNFILATMLQSVNIKHSQYFASLVQNFLNDKLEKIGIVSRGVKQGPFWVMVGATMPNVLIETGYISHKHEERILSQTSTQKKIAEGIFNGLRQYKEDIENAI